MILNLTTDSSAKYISLEVIEVIKPERIFELIASIAVKENGFFRDTVNYQEKNFKIGFFLKWAKPGLFLFIFGHFK